MNFSSRIFLISFFIIAMFSANGAGDPAVGEGLFLNKCASCHNKNMKDDLTGPALGGVEERWSDYPESDLYAWIRNSQKMISEEHPKAVELWNQWKPTQMNSFLNLSDDDIASLLAYIDQEYTKVDETALVGGPGAADNSPKFNTPLYIGLFVFLTLLAVVLARIVANLNYMAEVKAGNKDVQRRTLGEILTSRGMISFLIFAAVVLGGYTTVSKMLVLDRQQGYQPEQPIKFSHETHSGLHKIECQYCHDGARRSKHAVIPATNTCMNCHKAIKKGSQYGTAELTKIYASAGYDPNTDTYIENYEAMSQDEVKEVFTDWIRTNYQKDNVGDVDKLAETEKIVENQWEDIVSSLTNEIKDKVQGPIEWMRIHNLPDHAYFNHAQHVAVGKVECQTCHGPIQEMELVYQYSPLSMGWCVNCHRKTEVQFDDNDYYQSYEKYHQELQEGDRDKVTVEDVGGLGCQKCHY